MVMYEAVKTPLALVFTYIKFMVSGSGTHWGGGKIICTKRGCGKGGHWIAG